jgi:AcrR family transcriptional regulator
MITRKGQATRDRIVAAAAALMYKRGVAGTSTEDVQAGAGVSASQIYHYFCDKASLTRAVIDYQTNTILGFQEPLLARLDSLDALRSWAAVIVDIQRRSGFRGLTGRGVDHLVQGATGDHRGTVDPAARHAGGKGPSHGPTLADREQRGHAFPQRETLQTRDFIAMVACHDGFRAQSHA